jgi:hypothetical protein
MSSGVTYAEGSPSATLRWACLFLATIDVGQQMAGSAAAALATILGGLSGVPGDSQTSETTLS